MLFLCVFVQFPESIPSGMLPFLLRLAQPVVFPKISSAFASELKILQIYSTTSNVHLSMQVLYVGLHRASNVFALQLTKPLPSWRWIIKLQKPRVIGCSHTRNSISSLRQARLSCSVNMPSYMVYQPLLLPCLSGATQSLHHTQRFLVIELACTS